MHSLIHEFSQSVSQLASQSFIHLFIHASFHSVSQSTSQSVIQSCSHAVIQSFSQKFSHSFIFVLQSFNHSFLHSFIHSFLHSINNSTIQLFSRSVTQSLSHSVKFSFFLSFYLTQPSATQLISSQCMAGHRCFQFIDMFSVRGQHDDALHVHHRGHQLARCLCTAEGGLSHCPWLDEPLYSDWFLHASQHTRAWWINGLGELAGLGILGHCVRAILQAKLKESLKHIETY